MSPCIPLLGAGGTARAREQAYLRLLCQVTKTQASVAAACADARPAVASAAGRFVTLDPAAAGAAAPAPPAADDGMCGAAQRRAESARAAAGAPASARRRRRPGGPARARAQAGPE
jgi:hypothetical protein